MSLISIPTVLGLLDNVNGVPSHPLFVHFAVAVAVAGCIGGLAYALVPAWRRWLSAPLIAVGALSIFFGWITPSTGENLESRVPESALLHKHTDLGGQMGTIMIVFGLLLIVTMLVARYGGRPAAGEVVEQTTVDRIGAFKGEAHRAFGGQPQIAAVLTVLVFVLSIVSGIWIYRTGDAGAKAVWHGTPTTPIAGGDAG